MKTIKQATERLSQRKRLVFCTYPSIYSDIVLDELLRADEVDLVGVVVSTRMLRKNYNHFLASLQQIQQSGLRYAIYLFVVTAVYAGLQRIFRKRTLRQRLHHSGVPVLETQDINDVEGVAFIQSLQAETLLSAHFNQLIKEPFLESNFLTCLNIHPSLLPAYKGVDPAFYAMLRKEQVTGVTVHLQNEDFDSGEIIQQQSLQIRWHDSLLSLNMKLFKLGALGAIKQLAESGVTLAKQAELVTTQPKSGHYDSWPNPYDAKQFRKQRKFFRWKELIRFIRRSAESY